MRFVGLALMLILTGCSGQDHLFRCTSANSCMSTPDARPRDARAAPAVPDVGTATMAADAGTMTSSVADGGVVDGGADADSGFFMPHPPVPSTDASMPSCQMWGAMTGVPCVRWAPAGSCWFLNTLDTDSFDLLCEDNLPSMGWCECFGLDWVNDHGLPCCQPPY